MYVASVGPNLLEERMRVGRLLWSKDISAEYSTVDNPKLKKQMDEVGPAVLQADVFRIYALYAYDVNRRITKQSLEASGNSARES